VQFFAGYIDEQPPRLVIANVILHFVVVQRAEPGSRAAAAVMPIKRSRISDGFTRERSLIFPASLG
jgi:hypothetical protein